MAGARRPPGRVATTPIDGTSSRATTPGTTASDGSGLPWWDATPSRRRRWTHGETVPDDDRSVGVGPRWRRPSTPLRVARGRTRTGRSSAWHRRSRDCGASRGPGQVPPRPWNAIGQKATTVPSATSGRASWLARDRRDRRKALALCLEPRRESASDDDHSSPSATADVRTAAAAAAQAASDWTRHSCRRRYDRDGMDVLHRSGCSRHRGGSRGLCRRDGRRGLTAGRHGDKQGGGEGRRAASSSGSRR